MPAQHGTAFVLRKGDVLTVIDIEGGQVADLFCFDRKDLDPLSSGRSIDYCETIAFTTEHTLYSNAGNPLLRIVEDTCKVHDFLVTPCSLQMFQMMSESDAYHPSCLENLVASFAPFGIGADRVTTTFNAFMNVPVDAHGKIRVDTPWSKAGDHIAFEAMRDVIVGLTACADEGSNGGRCKPIAYEIARTPASAEAELEDANRAFHDGYQATRRDETLAPLFVLIGDELTVVRGGRRSVYAVIPQAFHTIKAVAHVAIAATLGREASDATRLRMLRTRIAMATADVSKEAMNDMVRVLADAERPGAMRDVGDGMLRLTRHATRIQLAALDAKVSDVLQDFDAEERRRLEVVVAGDHQARRRNLGMQYFARRLGEEEGADERVVGVNSTGDASCFLTADAARLTSGLADFVQPVMDAKIPDDCLRCRLTHYSGRGECVDELARCAGDADCVAVRACLNGCNTDDCRGTCVDEAGPGVALYFARQRCWCDACAVQCASESVCQTLSALQAHRATAVGMGDAGTPGPDASSRSAPNSGCAVTREASGESVRFVSFGLAALARVVRIRRRRIRR